MNVTRKAGAIAIAGVVVVSLLALVTTSGAVVGKARSSTHTSARVAEAASQRAATRAGKGYGFDSPDAVASDGTHVWVANANGDSVTELLASTGALVQLISGASYGFDVPDAVSSDGKDVWVANYNGNSVTELLASTGALVRVIKGSSTGFNAPDAVVSDSTHVWVANGVGNSVTELVASTGALVKVI